MLKPRSKTRKEFLQISKGRSLPASSLKMEGPSLTTTSRRSPLSILCSDLGVACRSLSRPSLAKQSLLKLNHQTQLRMSKPRSKTRKEFLQISRG